MDREVKEVSIFVKFKMSLLTIVDVLDSSKMTDWALN